MKEVYTPLNANARSVGGLLRRLEAKFPVSLKAASISNVYQKNRNNLVRLKISRLLTYVG